MISIELGEDQYTSKFYYFLFILSRHQIHDTQDVCMCAYLLIYELTQPLHHRHKVNFQVDSNRFEFNFPFPRWLTYQG